MNNQSGKEKLLVDGMKITKQLRPSCEVYQRPMKVDHESHGHQGGARRMLRARGSSLGWRYFSRPQEHEAGWEGQKVGLGACGDAQNSGRGANTVKDRHSLGSRIKDCQCCDKCACRCCARTGRMDTIGPDRGSHWSRRNSFSEMRRKQLTCTRVASSERRKWRHKVKGKLR